MSLEIESVIFDGESVTTVLRAATGKVSYTLSRNAIAGSRGQSDLFERAKSVLIGKLANKPTSAPKGGYHLDIEAADLTVAAQDATNVAA